MADESAHSSRLIVSVDKAGLSCTLTILPGREEEIPSDLELRAVLEEQRIAAAAIDADAIDDLIAAARENPDEEHSACVARGTPPRDGEHAGFTLRPELADRFEEIEHRRRALLEQGEPAPGDAEQVGEGAVDFREMSAFVIVHEGEEIGMVSDPSDGSDGTDVRGETIPAKKGHSLQIRTDHTTRVRSGWLVAAVSGKLLVSVDRVAVEPTLTIDEDVDYSTGNIDFPGDVVVRGSIKDQFRVCASGDVRVDSLVEAATIDCDGDLTLSRGMAGRDAGELRVGRTLRAGYLDGVRGLIEGACIVTNEIKQCRLRVGRAVESPACVFYGGELLADHRIELGIVGSEGGVETSVGIGAGDEIDDLAVRIEGLIDTIKAKRDRAGAELDALNKMARKLNAMQAERLTELQFEQIRADELTARLGEAAVELLSLFTRCPQPTLSVRRTLHAGARVRLRHVGFTVRDTIQGPVTFNLDRTGSVRCFFGNAREPSPIKHLVRFEDTGKSDPVDLLRSCALHLGLDTGDPAPMDTGDDTPPAQAA